MPSDSGFLGVYQVGRTDRFKAQGTVKPNKRVNLGTFSNPLAAARVRDEFVKANAPGAKLNFDDKGEPLNCSVEAYEHWKSHYSNR